MAIKTIDIVSIYSKDNKPLTKEQETFNKLTKCISTLTNRIEKERKKLDNILTNYNKQLPGKQDKLTEYQMQMATLLNDVTQKFNYSSNKKYSGMLSYISVMRLSQKNLY